MYLGRHLPAVGRSSLTSTQRYAAARSASLSHARQSAHGGRRPPGIGSLRGERWARRPILSRVWSGVHGLRQAAGRSDGGRHVSRAPGRIWSRVRPGRVGASGRGPPRRRTSVDKIVPSPSVRLVHSSRLELDRPESVDTNRPSDPPGRWGDGCPGRMFAFGISRGRVGRCPAGCPLRCRPAVPVFGRCLRCPTPVVPLRCPAPRTPTSPGPTAHGGRVELEGAKRESRRTGDKPDWTGGTPPRLCRLRLSTRSA